MPPIDVNALRPQLEDRRQRLDAMIREVPDATHLVGLLQEVDSALERIEDGSYGICDVCHDAIEADRLQVDPLIRVCLDHLDTSQQRVLEQDLELASRIQNALLPEKKVVTGDISAAFRYLPAGPVSGDYCDLIVNQKDPETVLFVVGDVSGKGIAASLLMSHLHAVFHSLNGFDRPVNDLMEHANRLFCESTLSTHFATLVCGLVTTSGTLHLCNAGHCPPVVIGPEGTRTFKANGLPLGMFCQTTYTITEATLPSGSTLFLYTDGLNEANNGEEEYGEERVLEAVGSRHALAPEALLDAVSGNVDTFLAGRPRSDDFTLMAIRRAG